MADLTVSNLDLRSVAAVTTLRDEAIQTLHAAVITGVLRPGVVYSAPTLAVQLGMSATPVREAMLDLVKEGLVETVRNKGFRVVELTDTELDELTQIRMMVEVPTVREIAERGITDDEYAELSALAAAMEQTASTGDVIAHNKADLAFHTRLLELAGNRTLVELIANLRKRSRLYAQAELATTGALVPSAHEHVELIESIRARDADAAATVMRRHIGHVRGLWATGSAAED